MNKIKNSEDEIFYCIFNVKDDVVLSSHNNLKSGRKEDNFIFKSGPKFNLFL